MKLCSKCKTVKDFSEFTKQKDRKDGHSSQCNSCRHLNYVKNKERVIAKIKQNNLEKRDLILSKKKARYQATKKEISQLRKQKRSENPGKDAKLQKDRRREIRLEVIKIFGGSCSCGVDDPDILCIDHMQNDGKTERSKGEASITFLRRLLKNPDKTRYQLLCFNCNQKKAYSVKPTYEFTNCIKRCPTCNLDKDESEFKFDSGYSDSRYYECRNCVRSRCQILKMKALSAIGSYECISCGESDIEILTFDHIHEDGNGKNRIHFGNSLYKRISENPDHARKTYQILCINCNIKKHRHFIFNLSKMTSSYESNNFLDDIIHNENHEKLIPHEVREFDFKSVSIQKIDVKEAIQFLEKYHYIKYGRFGSLHIGAFLDGELISVIKYSSPIRVEVATSCGFDYSKTLELDRFCIHPTRHVKNFASWLLSRSIKIISQSRPDIDYLISFADPNAGHDGTIYKAANWNRAKLTNRKSYAYVNERKQIIHKKTVYNRAVSKGLTELEYVKACNYNKLQLPPKHKFFYVIKYTKENN